ncbi:DMT family transporter [Halomonas sp. E19]|uniref:DMT family transporter n=1 Tax=Halomonas sp. E19 TaxID=3397247 RepID=UPI00403431C6
MFLGAGKLTSGIATVLANVQPLIAAVLAYWYLKEVLSRRMLAGLLIGFVGVVVIALPGLDPSVGRLEGALYVLAGALGTAVGNVLLKRRSRGGDLWLPMGLQLMIGAAFLAAGSMAMGEEWAIRWSWTFASTLFALSVPATALMVVLWYALLARAPLTRLNPVTFLTPAFGLLIGILMLGERFSAIELTGVAITLLGLALILRPGHSLTVPEVGDN